MITMDKAVIEQHAKNPKPGDYWSDRLSPVCVVISTKLGFVIFCKDKKDVDSGHWTWDLTKLTTMTIPDFDHWLSYKHIDGYWAELSVEAHLWAVEKAHQLHLD